MKNLFKTLTLSLFAILAFTTNLFSEQLTLKGTIQGASCVINKTYCPEDSSDPAVVLENDFVFVDEAKNHYFLTNVGKFAKINLLNEEIDIVAKKNGKKLMVDSIFQGNFKIWDYEQIKESLSRPNN